MRQVVLVAVVAPVLVCVSCQRESGRGQYAVASPKGCDGPRPEKTNWAGSAPALIDLDCDGAADTVRVTWLKGTRWLPQITVSGSIRATGVFLSDELPQLVEFGDVNGDGIRDIVAAFIDESSVLPFVLLVLRDTLLVVRFPDTQTARQMQFTFGDVNWPDACVDSLVPSIVVLDSLVAIEVRTGEYRMPGDCSRASRARLLVRDRMFVVHR
jgi:hypothetical protein